MAFRIPAGNYGQSWRLVLDTNTLAPVDEENGPVFEAGTEVHAAERSLIVLKRLG